MSQAVIDFCEGLKTTLLAVEDRLAKAKRSLDAGAAHVGSEAKKHIEEASEQLAQFKTHAGLMAQAIRADLPEQTASMREKLKDFGAEAQVAMRHAVVFLAETTSKGAGAAAGALKGGAEHAHAIAEKVRRETTETVVQPGADADKPATSG